MTAHDTLRWGDTETLVGLSRLSNEGVLFPVLTTKQLVSARWRWPITWNVQVVILPMPAPTESRTFTLAISFNLGVGQGFIRMVKKYVLAPVAGAYADVLDNFNLPAQDIQSQGSLTVDLVAAPSEESSIQVGLFVAPLTEPHAMTHMLDEYVKGQPPSVPQWMPEGFHPEPLAYHGNR